MMKGKYGCHHLEPPSLMQLSLIYPRLKRNLNTSDTLEYIAGMLIPQTHQ
jgi:hypothetical protein